MGYTTRALRWLVRWAWKKVVAVAILIAGFFLLPLDIVHVSLRAGVRLALGHGSEGVSDELDTFAARWKRLIRKYSREILRGGGALN